MAEPKTFTAQLTQSQAKDLVNLMKRGSFEMQTRPYMLAFGKKGKLSVAVYEKGPKVVVQGKETSDFVQFTLEPEILGEARLGYEEVHPPEHYQPHFGVDESGKGDFFGPLVIAGVYVDGEIVRELVAAGVTDSKRISSDARIRELAEAIRSIGGVHHETILISPQKYNELYRKIGNLNKLLAWGHARVIGNLATQVPTCPRALSDKFGNPRLIENSLKSMDVDLVLEQRTKAESDPAVAAASIIAREGFINWMGNKSRALEVELPRGASAKVRAVATDMVAANGAGILNELAKTHFRTASEIAPAHYPATEK